MSGKCFGRRRRWAETLGTLIHTRHQHCLEIVLSTCNRTNYIFGLGSSQAHAEPGGGDRTPTHEETRANQKLEEK